MNSIQTPFIVFLAALTSTLAIANEASSLPPHFVSACTIFKNDGSMLRRYPGDLCLFLDDGRFVSSSSNPYQLRMYGPKMEVLWEKNLHVHHQINLTADRKHFLIGSSVVHLIRGVRSRFDKLIEFDFDGKEIASYDFYKHREDLAKAGIQVQDLHIPSSAIHRYFTGAEVEFSHMNSFYSIEHHADEELEPGLKPGGFIVNSYRLGIFTLDAKMKHILWRPYPYQPGGASFFHDVQLQRSGKILIYANHTKESEWRWGSIEEYDPIAKSYRIIFQGNPPSSFAPRYCGGVQKLSDGQMLISDVGPMGAENPDYFLVGADGKIEKMFPGPFKDSNGKAMEFQQIKAVDLSSFLKNSQYL